MVTSFLEWLYIISIIRAFFCRNPGVMIDARKGTHCVLASSDLNLSRLNSIIIPSMPALSKGTSTDGYSYPKTRM